MPRLVPCLLVAVAIAAGTFADRPSHNPPLTLGGYRVLAVDFHTHSSMWSDGALTPWGLVLEARRQGLDAFAITAHNETWDAHVGQRFSRLVGGPIVLVGEEIVRPSFHLIAAGITTTVTFMQSAAGAIDEVHRQGGIAIAAHPDAEFWEGFDAPAMQRLDGAEICHPSALVPELVFKEDVQRTYEIFAARAPLAAIGSSDFHGLGPMGLCRTYVFADAVSEQGILDAVRAHRTVVYGRDGRVYGDPALVQLAAQAGGLRDREPARDRAGWPDWVSRIAGLLGLAGLIARSRHA
jgi:PHP-associated